MQFAHTLTLLSVLSGSLLLGGCAAVALAPAVIAGAGIAGGSMESTVQVTINESTITPETRQAWASAKTLAVVAGDRGSVKAADVFETKGNYLVTIDRSTAKNGELTGSERREALRKLCANPRPDIAMLGRITKSNNTGAIYMEFTGRHKQTHEWAMDVLVCRSNSASTFTGTIEFDLGMMNLTSQSQVEEMIGTELGGKILQVLGSAPPADATATAGAGAGDGIGSSSKTAAEAKRITMTPMEIQQKLIDLGYLKGKADGIFGKMSVAALIKFQRDSKLPETGKADDETLAKLAAARKT